MLEGLPPNGASHVLRLVCDQRCARAIADIIVETFDPTETAAAAFEEPDGVSWAVEIYFAEPPDEDEIRELIAAVSDVETAQAARFEQIAKQDWVQNALAGLKPVRAGRLVVHGSHDRGKLRANDIGVEIEAASMSAPAPACSPSPPHDCCARRWPAATSILSPSKPPAPTPAPTPPAPLCGRWSPPACAIRRWLGNMI
jgi:hypothetical protein